MWPRKHAIYWIVIVLSLTLFPCWVVWHQNQESMKRHLLFAAIRSNNSVQVKALLDSGADPNLREMPARDGTLTALLEGLRSPGRSTLQLTPLLSALYHLEHVSPGLTEIHYNPEPNPEIIRALLERGANAKATDSAQTPPVVFAASSGSTEVVGLLLKHGAAPNRTDPIWTTLLLNAAGQGRVEMIRYLLANGADIKARDPWGQSALICAVRFARSPDAVKLLLDEGVDVYAKDKRGRTALFYARFPSRALAPSQTRLLPQVITLLKNAGAK